jgi:glucokinase
MTRIVAGDLGGTRLRLGVFRVEGAEPVLEGHRIYASARFDDLEQGLQRFLEEMGVERVDAACIGVAGAVVGNRSRLTNLAWEIDGERLGERLGIPRVLVINDLVATAYGLQVLAPEDLVGLHPGVLDPVGNAVLVGIGTGLGIAFLVRCGAQLVAVPSEGGHADFPPRDELEWGLSRYLGHRTGGRVSLERVVSGPGLHHIYEYLVDGTGEVADREVDQRMAVEDPAQVIAEAGLDGSCAVCARAVAIFASACGNLAGNMALVGAATGGVYLAGGVAAKLVPRLPREPLLRSYLDKGRLGPFVERVPLSVVRREDTGFLGAARWATTLVEGPATRS